VTNNCGMAGVPLESDKHKKEKITRQLLHPGLWGKRFSVRPAEGNEKGKRSRMMNTTRPTGNQGFNPKSLKSQGQGTEASSKTKWGRKGREPIKQSRKPYIHGSAKNWRRMRFGEASSDGNTSNKIGNGTKVKEPPKRRGGGSKKRGS